MTREDWIAFFEAMNERSPSPEEIAQAQAAGEFTDEAAAAQEATVGYEQASSEAATAPAELDQESPEGPDQQPILPETEASLGTPAAAQSSDQAAAKAKKVRKIKLGKKGLLGLVAGFLVLVLAGGLGAWYFFGQQGLDGTWENEPFVKDIRRVWNKENTQTDFLVNNETNPRFELTIANNEVTAAYKVNINYGRKYASLLNSIRKIYKGRKIPSSTYDDISDLLQSTHDLYESINEKEDGYSYDKSKAEVTKVLFKGTVDPARRTITLTWVNDKTRVSAGSRGNSIDLDDYTDLKKGDTLSYQRIGNTLTIDKVTYGTFTPVN